MLSSTRSHRRQSHFRIISTRRGACRTRALDAFRRRVSLLLALPVRRARAGRQSPEEEAFDRETSPPDEATTTFRSPPARRRRALAEKHLVRHPLRPRFPEPTREEQNRGVALALPVVVRVLRRRGLLRGQNARVPLPPPRDSRRRRLRAFAEQQRPRADGLRARPLGTPAPRRDSRRRRRGFGHLAERRLRGSEASLAAKSDPRPPPRSRGPPSRGRICSGSPPGPRWMRRPSAVSLRGRRRAEAARIGPDRGVLGTPPCTPRRRRASVRRPGCCRTPRPRRRTRRPAGFRAARTPRPRRRGARRGGRVCLRASAARTASSAKKRASS